MTMPPDIPSPPPDTRAAGQSGHIADHNTISDVLAALENAVDALQTGQQQATRSITTVSVPHGTTVTYNMTGDEDIIVIGFPNDTSSGSTCNVYFPAASAVTGKVFTVSTGPTAMVGGGSGYGNGQLAGYFRDELVQGLIPPGGWSQGNYYKAFQFSVSYAQYLSDGTQWWQVG